MKSYNYYKDILEKNGYHETSVESFNGIPSFVDFEDANHIVTLGVQPTDKYDKELSALEDGTEYMPDYDRMEVVSAFFEGPICNVAGYMDNDRSGIYLKDLKPIRYALLDAIGGDDYQEYYPHKMDMFEKCLWITHHIIEHEEFILEAHLKNIKRVHAEFDKIFKKFDFYQSYSSIFDCTEGSIEMKDNSDPFVEYKHKHSELGIYISTDCLTGELKIDSKIYDADDFENFLIDTYFKRDGEIQLDYRYLFDNDYTSETAYIVLNAFNDLRNYTKGYEGINRLKAIDLSKIPEKDYAHLISQIKEEIEKSDEQRKK